MQRLHHCCHIAFSVLSYVMIMLTYPDTASELISPSWIWSLSPSYVPCQDQTHHFMEIWSIRLRKVSELREMTVDGSCRRYYIFILFACDRTSESLFTENLDFFFFKYSSTQFFGIYFLWVLTHAKILVATITNRIQTISTKGIPSGCSFKTVASLAANP